VFSSTAQPSARPLARLYVPIASEALAAFKSERESPDVLDSSLSRLMEEAELPPARSDPASEPAEDPLASHRLLLEEPAGGVKDQPVVRPRRRRRTFPKKPPSKVRTTALIVTSAVAVLAGFLFSDRIVRLIEPGPSTPAPERIAPLEGQPPYTSTAEWPTPATPSSGPSPAKTDTGTSPQALRLPDLDAARVSAASVDSNVSGVWTLTTRLETARDRSMRNQSIGYRLELTQQGTRVHGNSYRVAEGGHAVPADARAPVPIEGTLEGNRLSLALIGRGANASDGGKWVLYLGNDGALRGRFDDQAGEASGQSVATRERAARD
jgi:hypothetical protein